MDRTGPREGGRRAEGLRPVFVYLTVALLVPLGACDSGEMLFPPQNALVRVQGSVTDPAGTGLEGAEVTLTLHETTACDAPVLRAVSVSTGSNGTYDVLHGLTDVGEDFEPREVCLSVRAEPPAERPSLEPAERSGFVVTLRNQREEPLDVVTVDLTLSAGDGG